MASDERESTLTADTPVEVPAPRARSRRIAATLQPRDPARYEILAEHGRGGLGKVSRAHDRELGRDVAIKELLAGEQAGTAGELRFLREALLTARLEHPGIVPIHEAGCWPDGTPFYVMKLVSGRPLKELIAARRTVEERLELLHHVIAVADAVAYAHERGIIHRDLKASNVIVGDFGETVVIDWGLAKDLAAPDEGAADRARRPTEPGEPGAPRASPGLRPAAPVGDVTETGEVLGTPLYMAPEQLRGKAVDQRADVYAIGALLWQLGSVERFELPAPALRHRALRRAGVDHDLATIITKALAPDPADRYADAGALARDLKAFEAGARISARRYSLLAVLAHWTRRHRALAAAALAATALAIVGGTAYVWSVAAARDRADAASDAAQALRRRAEVANDQLVLQNAELRMQHDPTGALRVLADYHGADLVRRAMLEAEARGRGVAEAVRRPHTDTIWFLAGGADGAIYSLGEDRQIQVTRGDATKTLASDVSPDVVYAYAAGPELLAYARSPSGLAVLDLKRLRNIPIAARSPISLALAPDGSRIAALDARGKLQIWRLPPGAPPVEPEPERTIPGAVALAFADPAHLLVRGEAEVQSLALDASPARPIAEPLPTTDLDARGDDVAIGDATGHVALLSLKLAPRSRLEVCRKQVNNVRLAPRARIVAFACQDGLAGVARYDERGALSLVDTFSTEGAAFFPTPDAEGAYVAVMGNSKIAYLYDVGARLVTRYEWQAGRVSFVAPPSPNFQRVLVGDVNGTIRIWKVPRPTAHVIMQAPDAIYGSAFSPDGQFIATDGSDGIVRRIRVADGAVTELRGHHAIVRRTSFSPDGRTFLSFSNDGTVRVWGLVETEPLRVMPAHGSVVSDAEYIEGGRRIASVGDDGRLLVWSPTGTDLEVRFQHTAPLGALRVLPHNGHLVVHDAAGATWDIAPDGATRLIRAADGNAISRLRASTDGRFLAIGLGTGAVTVYETTDYTIVHQTKMKAGIRQISFDPQNRDLLIDAEDGHVRLVELDSRRRLPWHELEVGARDVAYGMNGEIIAFVGEGGHEWFYSVLLDQWVYARDHTVDIPSGRFCPDGKQFVSTDRSGLVIARDIVKSFP